MMAPSCRRVIAALGLTQILAWGSSYYLLAVLAAPVVAETGWPLSWVVGSLSGGLLVAARVSPRVGAAGLVIVGLAPSLGGLLLERGGVGLVLGVLCGLAILNVAVVVALGLLAQSGPHET